MKSDLEGELAFDPFEILGFRRAPFLDPEEIKASYLRRIRGVHPDRKRVLERGFESENDRAVALNKARRILENEVSCLEFFLTLEMGKNPNQDRSVPDGLVDIFMKIEPIFKKADRCVQTLRSERSPILRAFHFEDSSSVLSSLSEIEGQLAERFRSEKSSVYQVGMALLQSEKADEMSSEKSKIIALKGLCETYRRMVFLERWLSKVREKSFDLTPF